MLKGLLLAAVVGLLAGPAFAHAGHGHTYMGTVTMLHDDHSFTMTTTDQKEITVAMSSRTRYLHADDRKASRSDLAVGMRVVVKMEKDGKTAATVKMSPARATN